MVERRNLYFEDRFGNWRLVKSDILEEDVALAIKNYVFQISSTYHIHYMRTWEEANGDKVYDVGSHTEFFHWAVTSPLA